MFLICSFSTVGAFCDRQREKSPSPVPFVSKTSDKRQRLPRRYNKYYGLKRVCEIKTKKPTLPDGFAVSRFRRKQMSHAGMHRSRPHHGTLLAPQKVICPKTVGTGPIPVLESEEGVQRGGWGWTSLFFRFGLEGSRYNRVRSNDSKNIIFTVSVISKFFPVSCDPLNNKFVFVRYVINYDNSTLRPERTKSLYCRLCLPGSKVRGQNDIRIIHRRNRKQFFGVF